MVVSLSSIVGTDECLKVIVLTSTVPLVLLVERTREAGERKGERATAKF